MDLKQKGRLQSSREKNYEGNGHSAGKEKMPPPRRKRLKSNFLPNLFPKTNRSGLTGEAAGAGAEAKRCPAISAEVEDDPTPCGRCSDGQLHRSACW